MKRSIIIPRHKSLDNSEVLNPFVHELKLSFLDKVQIAIMSITIAPIRLILIVLCLVSAWLLASLATSFRSPEDRKKPMSGWRLFLRPAVLLLCRAVFFSGGMFWVVQKGKQASAKEANILLLAPHSSFLDALPTVFLGLTSVVAKSSSKFIPIFGKLIEFSQPVLVNRKDPDSRSNTIKEIQKRGQSGGKWPQIIIFPEGTCSNRSCLISFKQGAFYPGVPVQPVCLKYPNKLDTVTWTWKGPGAFRQLWFTLCQFYTKVEIEFLPVYYPSEEEKQDAKLFAHNVREVMARALKCPVTDHTYDDVRLMSCALDLKMPASTGLVEFERLHSKLGLNFNQMREMLIKFKDIKGTNKVGKKAQITYEDFASYLHLPPSDALQQVFDIYDRSGSGTIDFREYVIGLSLVSAPVNNDSTIQLAFELYDPDKKGHISREDLLQILTSAFNITSDNADRIFSELDIAGDGKITLDEFRSYADKKPEYAHIFVTYQELIRRQESNGHTGDRFDLDDCILKAPSAAGSNCRNIVKESP